MGEINQADELGRLEELYGELTDAQIEAMWDEMEDFTDTARQALRAEIAKRGLDKGGRNAQEDPLEAARQALRAEGAERSEARGQDSPEAAGAPEARSLTGILNLPAEDALWKGCDPTAFDLVVIWNVTEPIQARQFMRLLDSAGIKAYLGPDNVESVEEYGGSYEGGVEIKVMKFQAKSAYGRLQVYAPPETEEDSSDDGYGVLCPSCNSRDVIFQGVGSQPGKQPELDAKYNWVCAACGHGWSDDGIEKPLA